MHKSVLEKTVFTSQIEGKIVGFAIEGQMQMSQTQLSHKNIRGKMLVGSKVP